MTTANKPRCFQVVPLPGVFNRGRWECWDFKESEEAESKENDATDKNAASASINSTGAANAANQTPHSASNLQAPAQGSSNVAIENSIEQAMDLVKTHLTFAVREQVENLRQKIYELESKVVHLEAENSILKEHIPEDVLQNLSLQPSTTSNRSNNTS
ncbi:hypothetical protein M3Y97_00220700 [Aphelenchoides bicaudatus]|nr:hypothetical protein M3Y97_00220700 [Aphelenchoides bicaudatus]